MTQSAPHAASSDHELVVDVLDGLPENLVERQAQLEKAGCSIPFEHRAAWLEKGEDIPNVHVVVCEPGRDWRCAFPVLVASSRALPGHRILRAVRFGAAVDDDARRAAVRAFCELAETTPRVLRAHLQVYTRDDQARASIAEVADSLGFGRPESVNPYRRTVTVDLEPDEDEIMLSFHKSGRQNIRAPGKKGFGVRAVEDRAYAVRCRHLLEETYARTGGDAPDIDWEARIGFARDHPDIFRIVGTFQPGVEPPDSLVAFACGRHCGDYAVYSTAASTRDIDSNVSLTYAPAWELIRWARSEGATWFDFGGITEGSEEDSDDPLGGISDFKRYFTEDVAEVGDEWVLEPSPIRSWIARRISEGVRRFT